MQKKTIVLALGLAFGAASLPAQADVKIYGKLYPQVGTAEGSGATDATTTVSDLTSKAPTGTNNIPLRTGMSANNTRLGFRGDEDLGNGLKAIFQIESKATIDSGSSGYLANRNSFVGLKGAYGTLRFGHMDTPFKKYGAKLSFLGVSSGNFVSSSSVLRKVGFGTSSSSSFHLRRKNAVDYKTPNFGGMYASVQWSTDELTNISNDVPNVLSMGLAYKSGPLYVGFAYEVHNNLFGGSKNAPGAVRNSGTVGASSKDSATEADVEYRIGIHRFEVNFIQKKYTEDTPATGRLFKDYQNNAFLVAWQARWSSFVHTQLMMVKASAGSCSFVDGSTCSTTGLDGTEIAAGVALNLSKKTSVFALYADLKNGDSAMYDNDSFSPKPNPGEDIRQMAVGMSHKF